MKGSEGRRRRRESESVCIMISGYYCWDPLSILPLLVSMDVAWQGERLRQTARRERLKKKCNCSLSPSSNLFLFLPSSAPCSVLEFLVLPSPLFLCRTVCRFHSPAVCQQSFSDSISCEGRQEKGKKINRLAQCRHGFKTIS